MRMQYNMEKCSDIIAAIKNQPPVSAPDRLVDQVMARLEAVDQSAGFKIHRFLLRPQKISTDWASIFSGRITSYQQCVFLLSMVGFFYLVAGIVTLWGLYDAMIEGQINLWLRIQPHVTIASAILIMSLAVMVIRKPRMIIFAEYGLILHTVFMIVNALVLEFIIVTPIALIFVLGFSGSAIVTGILLISAVHNYIKFGLLITGKSFV